jgi:predicted dehydrogenase
MRLASAALRAGKHVLVEKPLATSLADGGALSEIAAHHDRTLMVGHTFLYAPPVLKLKELLTDGTMGDVFYIESQRVNLGRYQDAGVLWDLAPHDLSIILFWLGEVPCGVSATGRSVGAGSRPDVVFINLDFPERRGRSDSRQLALAGEIAAHLGVGIAADGDLRRRRRSRSAADLRSR